MKEEYLKECEAVFQNCTYTAETHHIIARYNKKLLSFFQLVPAIIAALSGILVVGEVFPLWWIWVSVIASIITAVSNVLNPLTVYYENMNAAKNFTALKHDARYLRDTNYHIYNEDELCAAVRILHDKYNDLIKIVPPTDDKSFERARKKVRGGLHNLDA